MTRHAKQARPKAVKAWALTLFGGIQPYSCSDDRQEVVGACARWGPSLDPTVIRVEIRPVQPKRRKRKA